MEANQNRESVLLFEIKKLAVAVAASTICGLAAAGPYVVGSAGVTSWDVDCQGASTCDKTDIGFKLLGGYRFDSNFAIEAGYFNFGKAKVADSGLSGDFKADGFGAGVAFHMDLSPQWNAVARLGALSMKTKLDATLDGFGSASDDDRSTQAYVGFGVGYRLTPNLSLDGAIDLSKIKFDSESGNVSKFSLGLSWNF
jgi:OOP family OmpA-OmpF porin